MTWKEWVEQQPDVEKRKRRMIMVQIISCRMATYSWQSYENALKNLDSPMFLPPDEMTNVIQEASALGKQFGWSPSKLRSTI